VESQPIDTPVAHIPVVVPQAVRKMEFPVEVGVDVEEEVIEKIHSHSNSIGASSTLATSRKALRKSSVTNHTIRMPAGSIRK
jgi:hypothetical protein